MADVTESATETANPRANTGSVVEGLGFRHP